MKNSGRKLLTLLLAILMILSCMTAAIAAEDGATPAEAFDYDGDEVSFIKDDGSPFGMFAPQEGTTCVIDGNNVVIHFVPKNTTVYGSLHFGSIYDELTADVTFNEDGSFDISLPKANCGKAIPVAPIKVKDGGTTTTQYYLAIPAADKLEDITPPAVPFDYDGDTVNFIKDDGSQFGMFTPQEGTTCVIDGNNVVIHFVPKNTTVYGSLHFGSIYDELTADVTFNEDGSFDISLPKDNCGKAIPVAPIKVKDGATTSAQYYLAIPAADKLEDITDEDPGDEPAEDITVTVTISVSGEFVTAADGTLVAGVPVTVSDLDESGDFNIDEVLIAAHDAFYPGGAAAGYASSVGKYGLAVDVLWGDTSYAFGYYVNHTMAMGLADPVEDGGYVQAYVYADREYYSDSYSYFDKLSAETDDGQITLTLYGASYDADWNPVFSPVSGAAITVNGEAGDYVTGADGQVTITFEETGEYLISAVGGSGILVPPVSRVSVTGVSDPGGEDDGRVDLEIINNTGMFKGLYAYVETVDGESTLVVALTGSTYRFLIEGNYAQAVAKGEDRSDWIPGEQDKDGKWFFRIPLEDGQTYIPVISVSQTYLDKYEAGENPLERSYYPRQFELDLEAGTLTVGDYAETLAFTVTSTMGTFRTASETEVSVVGGPNSNNYRLTFSLEMEDRTYDRVTYPTVTEGEVGTESAGLSEDGLFSIDLLNAPTKEAFRDGEPISMSFRVKATGEERTYTVTVDLLARTILIDGDDEGVVTSDDSDDEEETEAGLTVDAEVEDGTAKAEVETEAITGALEESEDAPDTLVITVNSEDADAVELTLPEAAIEAAAQAGISLTVNTEQGDVTLDRESLDTLYARGGDVLVTVAASEDGSMQADASVDGNSADVQLRVALPADSGRVLILKHADGSEETVRKSMVENGRVYAVIPAGSRVRLADNSLSFDDVKDNWFREAVDFATSHELFLGVSDTEFAPNAGMTRAMLVTVLYRLEGEPEVGGRSPFDDVPAGKWYTDAVIWASAGGIVNGTGSGFAPNDPVTREQIAVILCRYAARLGMDVSGGSLAKFPDADKASSWAAESLGWACRAGLIRGDDAGNLNPKGSATRAEVASLFMRLIALMVR